MRASIDKTEVLEHYNVVRTIAETLDIAFSCVDDYISHPFFPSATYLIGDLRQRHLRGARRYAPPGQPAPNA